MQKIVRISPNICNKLCFHQLYWVIYHLIPENWAEAVTAEIIRLISIQSEKTSLDEKELMQFLTLVSPDKLAKISIATILEYTPKTRTEDRIVDNLENGTILAVNLVQELGDKVCREYNMQELSKPKNKRLVSFKLILSYDGEKNFTNCMRVAGFTNFLYEKLLLESKRILTSL